MKRISALILTICLVLMMGLTVSADSKAGITAAIADAESKQGTKIDIPIVVSENSGLWGMQIELDYDQKVLRYDGLTVGDAFKEEMDVLETNARSYPAVVNAMANSLTENCKATGQLAVMHFFVYVGATLGDSVVKVEFLPNNVIDVDANEVSLTVNSSFVVKVTEGLTSTDNEDDLPPVVTSAKRDAALAAKNGSNNPSNSGENSKKWIWFVVGGVIVLAAVILIWLFAGGDDDDDDDDDTKKNESSDTDEVPDWLKE